MQKISLEELRRQPRIDRVLILSLQPALYTLRAVIDEQEYLVQEKGANLRRHSAEAIKQLLLDCPVGEFRLVHQSPYDEMIGQPGGGENRLDVPTAAPVKAPDISRLH